MEKEKKEELEKQIVDKAIEGTENPPKEIETPEETEPEMDIKSENERLKGELAKAQQTIQQLEEKVMEMTNELGEYKEIAEQRTRDIAWQKQSTRLPEKYRNENIRQLFEKDKDGFIDFLAGLIMQKNELERDAEGVIHYPPANEVQTTNKLADLGYEIIVK